MSSHAAVHSDFSCAEFAHLSGGDLPFLWRVQVCGSHVLACSRATLFRLSFRSGRSTYDIGPPLAAACCSLRPPAIRNDDRNAATRTAMRFARRFANGMPSGIARCAARRIARGTVGVPIASGCLAAAACATSATSCAKRASNLTRDQAAAEKSKAHLEAAHRGSQRLARQDQPTQRELAGSHRGASRAGRNAATSWWPNSRRHAPEKKSFKAALEERKRRFEQERAKWADRAAPDSRRG